MSAELRDIFQRNYARMKAAGQIPTGKGKGNGNGDGPEPTAGDKEVLDKLNEMMNTPGFIQDDVARVGRLIKHLKGALDKADREDTVKELRKVYQRNAAAIKQAQGAKGGRAKTSASSSSMPKAPAMKERSRSRGAIAVI